MHPGKVASDQDLLIPFDTTLEDLIPMLIGLDGSRPVVDVEGNVVGSVDQETLLMALAGE